MKLTFTSDAVRELCIYSVEWGGAHGVAAPFPLPWLHGGALASVAHVAGAEETFPHVRPRARIHEGSLRNLLSKGRRPSLFLVRISPVVNLSLRVPGSGGRAHVGIH